MPELNRVSSNHRSWPLDQFARIAAYTTQLLHTYMPVVTIFVLSRILFYVVVIVTASRVPIFNPDIPPPTNLGYFINAHYRWDANHYFTIATHGYPRALASSNDAVLAFFPLLPTLIGLVCLLLGVTSQFTAALIGIILNHALFLLALCLLYRLALDDTNQPLLARRTVLYTALFPLGVFYSVPYTEALFLALSVGAFLATRHRHWVLAGLIIALATATRLTGVALIPVLLIELALAWRHKAMAKDELRRGLLGVMLAPLGLVIFLLYLWQHVGDPFVFLSAQRYWGRELLLPPLTLWRGIQYVFHPEWSEYNQKYLHGVYNTLIVICFLVVTLISARRWRLSYLVYSLSVLSLALLSPLYGEATMQSTGRYVMIIFPVLITCAVWLQRPVVHRVALATCISTFVLVSVLFSHNFWII